jgi:ABC-2 type transport system ATP-binding protein
MTASAPSSSAAIDVRGLHKVIRTGFWGRPRTLLSDVSFRVEPGTVTGFVGPNGAGKSTTIKHLVGGSRPTKGTIEVFGVAPTVARARRQLGYAAELPLLPQTLTPFEIMRLHAHLAGVTDKRRVDEVLALVELQDRAHDRLGGFSKGMQQRLALGLALVHRPALLILDEPMSGLDPMGRGLVRAILREEARRGTSILFSSHTLSDVEQLCEQLVLMNKGQLLYTGTVHALISQSPPDGADVRLELALDAPIPPALSSFKSDRLGTSLIIHVPPGADPIAVAVAARDAGLLVRSVEPRRGRLEDIVIALLQEKAS